MQGLESLSQFKNFVSSLGGLGRYGDTYMVHAEEGETVVPMEVLDRNPVLKKRLFKSMKALGIDPGRYIVGNDLNSLNPVTGQPEFFLKNIGKWINRVMPGESEQLLPLAAAFIPGLGPVGAGLTGAGLAGLSAHGAGRDPWGPALAGGLGAGFGRYGLSKLAPNAYVMPDDYWGKEFLPDLGGKLGLTKSVEDVKLTNTLEEAYSTAVTGGEWEDAANIKKLLEGTKKGVPMNKIIGTGLLLGLLEKYTTKDDEDVGDKYEYELTGDIYDPVLNPQLTYSAEGGIMDLQGGGESRGPGTGTSDSIPAMLSDGEFVMTADAVRGAGGGDRREGARRMYEAMDRLEARA